MQLASTVQRVGIILRVSLDSKTAYTILATVTRIGIIASSSRPGRNGLPVTQGVYDIASQRDDATYEPVDLLPHLDEPLPPSHGQYQHDHSTSGAPKNAIDYLYAEWNNKAVAFVGCASPGRAPLMTDLEDYATFKRGEHDLEPLGAMLDQLVAWSNALAPLRST